MRITLTGTLLLLSATALPDAIVFETDFTGLPSGWYNDRWTFDSLGAHAYHASYGDFMEFDMSSMFATPQVLYFVPDGTDSVVVHVEHSLRLSAVEGCSRATCHVSSTTTGGGYIYDESVFWYETFNDAAPIVHTMEDPPEGTWLGFSFHAQVEDEYHGVVSWNVKALTVTAFGNELVLDQDTWAGIKRGYL